jgi:hypothetical protein
MRERAQNRLERAFARQLDGGRGVSATESHGHALPRKRLARERSQHGTPQRLRLLSRWQRRGAQGEQRARARRLGPLERQQPLAHLAPVRAQTALLVERALERAAGRRVDADVEGRRGQRQQRRHAQPHDEAPL